jgi:hypothetical protein
LTTPIDLTLGAARHGVRLESRQVASAQQIKPPAIVLVHYGSLPRLDANYTAGHWVVVTRVDESGVKYHDPDWWEPRLAEGANRTATLDVFERAMQDCALDGNPAGLVLEVT